MKKLFSSILSCAVSMAITAGVCVIPASDAVETEKTALAESKAASLTLKNQDAPTIGELFGKEFKYDQQSALESLSDTIPKLLINNNSGAYNYGDFLDANNKAVYNEFVNLIAPSTDLITIELPEPVTINTSVPYERLSTNKTDFETYSEAVSKCFNPGVCAALFDIPDIFWLDQFNMKFGVRYSTRGNFISGYKITISALQLQVSYFDAFKSLEDVNEYREKLEQAVADFMPDENLTRYDRLKALERSISEFTYYDADADFSTSAIGAMVKPGVVCEGYSEAFKLMCDRMDIPCICVAGNLNSDSNSGHMWNYVQMDDGKWYGIDLTWDDVDGSGGKEIIYDNFLRGSVKMSQKHTPVTEYMYLTMEYPELSTTDFNPYLVYSTTTTTATTTSEIVTEIVTEPVTDPTTEPITEPPTDPVTAPPTEPVTDPPTDPVTEDATTEPVIVTDTTEPTTEIVFPKGDVNQDSVVNISDLVYCIQAVLGKCECNPSCDLTGNGKVNGYDVIMLRRIIFK